MATKELTPDQREKVLSERYPDIESIVVTPEVVEERTKALWNRKGAWN